MLEISSQLPSLKKFRVIPQDTLFPIDKRESFKTGLCQKCGKKLVQNYDPKLKKKLNTWYCPNKKHDFYKITYK